MFGLVLRTSTTCIPGRSPLAPWTWDGCPSRPAPGPGLLQLQAWSQGCCGGMSSACHIPGRCVLGGEDGTRGGGGSGGADMSPRWGTHDDSFDHACTVSVETTGIFGLLARFPCLSLPSKASLCEPPKLVRENLACTGSETSKQRNQTS